MRHHHQSGADRKTDAARAVREICHNSGKHPCTVCRFGARSAPLAAKQLSNNRGKGFGTMVAKAGLVRALVCLLLTTVALALGCSEDRAQPDAGGVHPSGWGDKGSPNFHATWLKANQFPLSRCQECHGVDFAGGAVGVSCSQSNCHSDPDSGVAIAPIACTTCHGANGTPRPDSGAHWQHVPFCDTCHTIPGQTVAQIQQHASGDESTLIHFGNFATKNPAPTFDVDAAPTFDLTTKQCSNTYCHGASSPVWTDPAKLDCNGCHKAPPGDHARWSRLTTTTTTCANCHPDPNADPQHVSHVNGQIDITVSTCTTCHGSGNHANPPVDLDGGTDPTARGVGAHQRHLDALLSDRMGKPLPCNDCHVVPNTVTDPGHIDQTQTKVRFPFGGTYDSNAATCNVWCHFNKTPGPTWTDNSGAARACDACHAFPPVTTRANTPHPSVAGNLTVCEGCHVYSIATHVNGVVDFVP